VFLCCLATGYDGSNRINDFYEFNFKRKLWSVVLAIGSAPSPRDRHVAVVYRDSFYVFAGFDGSSRVNDFIEYNFCASSVLLSIDLFGLVLTGGCDNMHSDAEME
jgi:hypothetical protein